MPPKRQQQRLSAAQAAAALAEAQGQAAAGERARTCTQAMHVPPSDAGPVLPFHCHLPGWDLRLHQSSWLPLHDFRHRFLQTT